MSPSHPVAVSVITCLSIEFQTCLTLLPPHMCYLPLFFLIKKRDKLFASGIIYSQEIRQGQKEVGYLIY